MDFPIFLNTTLSWLVVLAQLISLKIILAIIFSPKKGTAPAGWVQERSASILRFYKKYAVISVLIVTLVAMAGSLSYSDILGYEPCVMCWYQRILMYPQVILAAVALAVKDRKVLLYTLVLSIIGAGFALYHYLLQLGVVPAPCSSVGYSVSCAKTFVLRLGYITIPMMAFAAFILSAIISWISYFSQDEDGI